MQLGGYFAQSWVYGSHYNSSFYTKPVFYVCMFLTETLSY